jgi:hypothetical protein
MGNGDESFVSWKHFRNHEQEAKSGFTRLTKLEVQHEELYRWKEDMEKDLTTFMVEQNVRHEENQKAMNAIKLTLTKMLGAGIGALAALDIALKFLKLG